MIPETTLPSPVTELHDPLFAQRGVRVFLKRDDLIDSEIPGNKWRKLVPNLKAAREEGYGVLLTFGGAWSNHIAATAAAGARWGFDTIGVIRGEEHRPLNPVLATAAARGMRLAYMDRTTYRSKASAEVIERLHSQHGDFYRIPEGGSNELAVRSCREIPQEIDGGFDVICSAVGTGGTVAGIAAGLEPHQTAIGFSALKGGEFLADEVERLQMAAFGAVSTGWRIECGYHFGGFARRDGVLDAFIQDFSERHGLALEWVYVAKMMFGVVDLIDNGYFPTGARIVAVITGPAA